MIEATFLGANYWLNSWPQTLHISIMLGKVAVEIVGFALPVFCNDSVMELFIQIFIILWSGPFELVRESVSIFNKFLNLLINPTGLDFSLRFFCETFFSGAWCSISAARLSWNSSNILFTSISGSLNVTGWLTTLSINFCSSKLE